MTRRTKKAWTKWRELISEQARSGQTVTAFCRERGLCRPYFFVWKKRLGEDTTTQFLEVQLRETTPSAVRDTRVEIRLRSEEHTSELQSQSNLVCRLLLEKKNTKLNSPAADKLVPQSHAFNPLTRPTIPDPSGNQPEERHPPISPAPTPLARMSSAPSNDT